MALLQNIITGTEPSWRCLVHDSSSHRASDVVRSFAAERLRRGGSVCAVLLETFPDDFVAAFAGSSGAGGALLESAVGAGMAIVDGSGSGGSEEEFAGAGAADGGGGGGGGGRVAHPGPASVRSAVALDDLKCIVDGVAEAIAKSGTGAGAGTCGRLVIIDSLTAYMALHSVSAAVRAIRRLSERADVDQVVAVIHSDVHDMDTLASLNHMASSTIAVRETGAGGRFPGEATITHRRRSGKVLAETVLYGVDRESVLRTSLVATGSDAAGDDGSASADPTANLSFNLNLTASQRQAKANVKLPYTMSQAEQERELAGGQTAMIHYEADDGDDVDEEDPDDDLDL